MSEKPLLLSAAKSAVMVSTPARMRLIALCAGVFVLVVGAADLTARSARAVLGGDASKVAFGPAIAALDPSVVATTTARGPFTPARLRIPAISVNAAVESVGQKPDGTMGTPSKFNDVAWYAPGPKPLSPGNAVFAGHVDNALSTAGVFEHLSALKKGDYVIVEDADGKSVVYRVDSVTAYKANAAPLDKIFATHGASQVVLITCAGDWVTSQRQYDERLVVIAKEAYSW